MEDKVKALKTFPIVVAIELGEKFAKVSYAFRENKEINSISSWPRSGIQSCRTPIVSIYRNNSTEIVTWGHRARLEMAKPTGGDHDLLENLMLPLDERTQVRPFMNGITPLQAITDYLKALQEYVVAEVLRGKMEYSPADLQYVFTYPYHWTNRAKDTMLRAVIGVGLVKAGNAPNRVIFVSECSAMANYCERSDDRIEFKDKDSFMICDARDSEGLQLSMYEVHKSCNGQVQDLTIVGRDYTGECGSQIVDANTKRLLDQKLRKFRGVLPAREWPLLLESFRDTIRPGFDGLEDQFLQLPAIAGLDIDDSDGDVDDGYLLFSAAELKKEVFDPVVEDILKLIHGLLQQEEQRFRGGCRAIFMVGEFGSSQYLLDRVRQEFKDQVELVTVPTRQELAITRGAVLAGLSYPLPIFSIAPSSQSRTSTISALPPSTVPWLPPRSQSRNGNQHLHYPQQSIPQQQAYASQVLQQSVPGQYVQPSQAFQQQWQQQRDTSIYNTFDMNSVKAALPTPLAPQAAFSSGMVASSHRQHQSGGYNAGPIFNPIYSSGNEGGGARLVGTTGGRVGRNTNNDSTGNGARPLKNASTSQPVAERLSYSNRPQELQSIQSRPSPAKNSEYLHAVMAVDFGTKFTKVSCAVRRHGYAPDILDVTFWDQTEFLWSDRTPTETLYMKGSTDIHHWGYFARKAAGEPKVKDNCCLLSNLKLHLDDTMEMPPFVNGLSPLKAISDYLNKVHEHAMEKALDKIPGHDRTRFQYYLTVPSHWSDRAKYTMRQTVIGAGMVKASDVSNRLVLLSEHDAMAYYCERAVDKGQFKDKDRFIICAAGEGGGVDVVLYEVNETRSGMVRHLGRVSHSHGGGCGSDILEANMLTLLERKLRKYRGEISAKGWQSIMGARWDIIREQFDGVEDAILILSKDTGLQNLIDLELGINEGYIFVQVNEMKEEVFEPVVSDVLELIQEGLQQAGEKCAALFMLGDFGPSPYIWERVRQECKGLIGLVAIPPSQSMALVHGALYAGMDSDNGM